MREASAAVTASVPKRFATVLQPSGRRVLMGVLFCALIVLAVATLYRPVTNACAVRLSNPAAGGFGPELAGRCVTFETASTLAAQAQGLSDRPSMPIDRGMLFVFKEPSPLCFWMKDMHFNLDIVWLDASNRVVMIRKSLSPDSYPEQYCSDVPATNVIEVNAGVVDASGIKMGDRLAL